MIFIPFLDRMTNQLETIRDTTMNIKYRGYEKITYPPPDIFGIRLPVNLIAYNQCKTQRDVFLFVTGQRPPESWDRYRGRVIHSLYEEIWRCIAEKVRAGSIDSLDLYGDLDESRNNIVNSVLRKHRSIHNRLRTNYEEEDFEKLKGKLLEDIEKVFSFERNLATALVNFEISRLFSQPSGDPLFSKVFCLSLNQNFSAPNLGFSNPVTPDFLYRNNIVGDIKIGPWKDYYYHTITAYALAIEYHTRSSVNCGVVLHVDLERPRSNPIHEATSFEPIDDSMRKKFLMIRDQKLLIARKKIDPGLPENQGNCAGCGYNQICWGEE
jgi:CRISPR/Cas system-associated exonuclease Cas4 (RecB family)